VEKRRGGSGKSGNYFFAGFSSLIFGLRGWGGVASSLRKISSGLGSVPSLRGSFLVIGKFSVLPLWKISDKESLVAWVRRFLWHYEGMASGNGPEEAPDNPALTIVDNIITALPALEDDAGKRSPVHLPDPEIYFQDEGNL
jgi:hypothetical protein